MAGSKTYNSGETEAEAEIVAEAVETKLSLEGVAIDECTVVACEVEIGLASFFVVSAT